MFQTTYNPCNHKRNKMHHLTTKSSQTYTSLIFPQHLLTLPQHSHPQNVLCSRHMVYPIHTSKLNQKALGSVGFTNKLAKVQQLAVLHITGELCSTATDQLDAHGDLIQIRRALDNHTHNSVLCLLFLPQHHPLHSHICKATCPIKQYKSPLHNIL